MAYVYFCLPYYYYYIWWCIRGQRLLHLTIISPLARSLASSAGRPLVVMVRLKTRYILFEVIYPSNPDLSSSSISLRNPDTGLSSRNLFREIRTSILVNFGELGLGQVQSTLSLRYYSPKTQTGILRVSREHARIVQGALAYISALEGKPVIIRVLRVSGAIKKSEQAAIDNNREFVHAMTEKTSVI